MSDTKLFRHVVKAFALGDASEAKRLDAQIIDADREAYNLYVMAVFFGAVGHRFGDDNSPEAVRIFASELRQEYPNPPEPIKLMVVEGLIRAVFGEDHLLDEISPHDQLLYQFPIIRKIVGQSPEMRERIEDYLTDAETLAKGMADETSG